MYRNVFMCVYLGSRALLIQVSLRVTDKESKNILINFFEYKRTQIYIQRGEILSKYLGSITFNSALGHHQDQDTKNFFSNFRIHLVKNI